MRALGFLLAVLALVAGGCGGASEMEEATPLPPPAETTPAPGAADRPPAPPIAGTTLEGEEISLADFRGKPVFVNVWSSW